MQSTLTNGTVITFAVAMLTAATGEELKFTRTTSPPSQLGRLDPFRARRWTSWAGDHLGLPLCASVTGLGDALDSQRYLDLLDRLHAAASNPPLTSGSDKTPSPPRATEVLPKVVSRRWRRIQKKVEAAGASPSDEQLHQIRIAAKNLRYACDLSRPVIGKAAKKTAKAAEDIQTILGDHHDAAASIDWLTRSAATASGRSGFAAGILVAEQKRQGKKLAKEWHHSWAKLSRPARRRWLA
ncbi:MAG: CHAD domain-containing protein [Acidimicrobiaceae bacterium]|nr:CHAD domain-containing protein [Acidimicrobiaceae bacterium]